MFLFGVSLCIRVEFFFLSFSHRALEEKLYNLEIEVTTYKEVNTLSVCVRGCL